MPMSREDKLCLVSVAALVLAAGIWDTAIVEADRREVESRQQQNITIECSVESQVERLSTLEEMPIVATLETHEEAFRDDIPLSPKLQTALRNACEENNVPVSLALGLIETESSFVPDADNGLCYGLFQLNRRYFPDGLSPADNIAAGVKYLSEQISRYDGDIPAALRAYNRGYDDGDRTYANTVIAAAERWDTDGKEG